MWGPRSLVSFCCPPSILRGSRSLVSFRCTPNKMWGSRSLVSFRYTPNKMWGSRCLASIRYTPNRMWGSLSMVDGRPGGYLIKFSGQRHGIAAQKEQDEGKLIQSMTYLCEKGSAKRSGSCQRYSYNYNNRSGRSRKRKIAEAQRGPRVGSFAEEPGLIYIKESSGLECAAYTTCTMNVDLG